MITQETLQKFCSVDEARPQLHKPFRRGDSIFATNGHIMVRVPVRHDLTTEPGETAAEDILDKAVTTDLHPLPIYAIPHDLEARCEECHGAGVGECSFCGHETECNECDGRGFFGRRYHAEIGGALVAGKNYKMIAALPNVRINLPADNARAPIYFTFDGGDGAVMGLREPYSDGAPLAPAQQQEGEPQ